MDGEKKKRPFWPILAAVCVLLFAAGFGACYGYEALNAPEEPPEETPYCLADGHVAAGDVQIRVNGGDVQWFDGERWNTAASAYRMESEDRFGLALEACHAFEQTLIEEQEAEEPVFRLPQTGRKAVQRTWTPSGGGGGGSSGGSGGSSGGGGADWSGDYL